MYIRHGVCAVLSCTACPSFAQSIPVTQAPPVIVTASRFEEAIGERPINATVITRDQIAQSPAKTIPELLSEQAGIIVHDLFGNNAARTAIDLRGFGAAGPQNTLVLVDGRRLSDIDLSGVQWSAVPLNAIERIEVVRGGGSVLYGEGASAGVINIITRSPQGAPHELTLGGAVGSYATHEAAASATYGRGPIGAYVFGSHYTSDGYRENNHSRQTNALADLRWSGSIGDFALKLGSDNQGTRLPGARTVQPSAGINELETDRRGTSTPLDWVQREGNRASLDWRRTTTFGEIDVGGGWREKSERSFFAFGGFPDYREVELRVWSLTPRVKIDRPLFGRSNSLVVGFDWYSWDYTLRRSNAQTNINQPANAVSATEDTAGLYALNTLRLAERITVSAGARRERFRLNANDIFDPTAPGAAFGSGAPAASQRLYQHAYDFAVRYEFAPSAALIGKTARSYRLANVDEIYESSASFQQQFQFLQPQTARTHELAFDVRRSAVGGRATLFVMDVNNEIHLDPFTFGVGNRNLPPSRRRGVEVEMNGRLGKLTLAGGYSYIEANFRRGVLPGDAFTQVNVDLAGRSVPLVPRNKATLRASWAFTEATRLSGVLSYVSDQRMDNDEPNTFPFTMPAYATTDLKLTHQRGPWMFAATVNNVFDRKYFTYAVRSVSAFTPDRYNTYPLPGRTGTLRVEYRFR